MGTSNASIQKHNLFPYAYYVNYAEKINRNKQLKTSKIKNVERTVKVHLYYTLISTGNKTEKGQ